MICKANILEQVLGNVYYDDAACDRSFAGITNLSDGDAVEALRTLMNLCLSHKLCYNNAFDLSTNPVELTIHRK
jgi:hypothetical protein